MKFRNFTPHTVNISSLGDFPSEGVARLKEERREIKVGWNTFGVSYTSIRYDGIEGLPCDYATTGDIYVTSRSVAEYLHLPCVVSPDKYIRNKEGQIIGCEGICWFPLEL